MINIKELEKKLRNVAEKEVGEVGNVGEPTSDKAYSPTGEQFTEFGCRFKENEDDYLLSKWEVVIRGLKHASLLKFGQILRDIGGGDNPKLYWRIYPEIKHSIDEDLYIFYARLLITCNHGLNFHKQLKKAKEELVK